MIIVAFGDSLTDPDTYNNVADEPWIIQVEDDVVFRHEIGVNLAEGGSVSGWKREINGEEVFDHVYQMDGVTLAALGMLGQVNVYKQSNLHNNNLSNRDDVVFVIWTGTNDTVIAAQLDPFTTSDGVLVDSTQIVKDDRQWYFDNNPGATDLHYAEFVIDNYTIKNIEAAITELESFGEVVVVGPFNLGTTPLAIQRDRVPPATHASHYFQNQLMHALENSHGRFVSLIDLDVTTIDEIHLDHLAQGEVMERIVTVRL